MSTDIVIVDSFHHKGMKAKEIAGVVTQMWDGRAGQTSEDTLWARFQG